MSEAHQKQNKLIWNHLNAQLRVKESFKLSYYNSQEHLVIIHKIFWQ